jgi:hypothetical protein
MPKFSKTILLSSAVILGFTVVLGSRAVAQVPDPSDIKPTDSTAQSVPSTPEHYGCLSGYGERTYQGDRPISRYEFAAVLNACLNQLNQRINSNTGERATQEDLAVPKRQLETLKSELERLRMRVDSLDNENTAR